MHIEGKTKIVAVLNPETKEALITNKDDLTAGNGARHEVLSGKGALVTCITANIFELLRRRRVPVAYLRRNSPTSFFATYVEMISVEVVIRQYGLGSYLKRHPEVEPDSPINPLLIEFYYKTSGRRIGDLILPQDDPMLIAKDGVWHLYRDTMPETDGYIAALPETVPHFDTLTCKLTECADIAQRVFYILSGHCDSVGARLQDLKLEFGINRGHSIVLADTIDCDSWRMEYQGRQLSKEPFRQGASLEETLAIYQTAAELSDLMVAKLPKG
jgi:phosphoribosylaminoimidazole-succinocarboxamide synthase